jgi:hypothetical protein
MRINELQRYVEMLDAWIKILETVLTNTNKSIFFLVGSQGIQKCLLT